MPLTDSTSTSEAKKPSKKKAIETVEFAPADLPAETAAPTPVEVAAAVEAPKVPKAPGVRTEETFTITVPSGLLVIGDPDHINHKWKGASVATGRFAVDFDGPEAMLLSTGARFIHPWEVLPDGVIRVRPASLPEAGAVADQAKNIATAQNYKTTVHMMNLDQTILEVEDACRKTGAGHLAYLDAACLKLDRVPGRRSAGVRQVTVVSVDGVPTEVRMFLR